MRKRTFRKQSDNSHWEVKLDLRKRFAEKVGADTCFDLFCGTGALTSSVWAPRFRKVVCVDKSAKQLEDFPTLENVDAYCGDNGAMLSGLIVRYGWPDVFDADAYGWPDKLTKRVMLSRVADKPFAVFGTNGGMAARKRGSVQAIPEEWGFGKGLSVAPFSAAMDAAACADFTHLREWAEEGGKTILDFEAHTEGCMVYWAAIVEPQRSDPQ